MAAILKMAAEKHAKIQLSDFDENWYLGSYDVPINNLRLNRQFEIRIGCQFLKWPPPQSKILICPILMKIDIKILLDVPIKIICGSIGNLSYVSAAIFKMAATTVENSNFFNFVEILYPRSLRCLD